MSENILLVQALAELSYSIALADGTLEKKEKEAFEKIIDTELGNSSSSAKNRFAILEERVSPHFEHSYKYAMFAIKASKGDFTEDLKRKFLIVIKRVANCIQGSRQEEKVLVERFKKDIELI